MRKTLVLLLVLGMVCLAVPAVAQQIGDADNGGSNQDTGGGTGVQVTNPNIAGATQGSGDGNTNMDGDNSGTQVIVPDANIAGATAKDQAIAVDADAAAQGSSTAQDNGGDANTTGNQANDNTDNQVGNGQKADGGGGTNVSVPDATVQALGKNQADDTSSVTDSSTSALGSANSGQDSTAQTGGTNVSVPDATVQLLGKQNADDASINNDASKNADAFAESGKAQDAQQAAMDGGVNQQNSDINANNLTTSPVQNRDVSGQAAMDTANLQTGNADQNGGTGNVAQEGTTNVNVPNPQVALAGKQAATGTGTNTDESASALLAKQVASGTGTNNDAPTFCLTTTPMIILLPQSAAMLTATATRPMPTPATARPVTTTSWLAATR